MHQVFPNPTDTNGYEDYLRAADMVSVKAFKDFLRWDLDGTGMPPTGLSNGSSKLARRKYLSATFQRALDLVHAGNSLQIMRPDKSPGIEFEGFMSLSELCVASSYVAYSSGDWVKGTSTLTDLLIFGSRIQVLANCNPAMGQVMVGRAVSAFGRNRMHWSLKECESVQKAAIYALAELALTTEEGGQQELSRERCRLVLLGYVAAIHAFMWHRGAPPSDLAAIELPKEIRSVLSLPIRYRTLPLQHSYSIEAIDPVDGKSIKLEAYVK